MRLRVIHGRQGWGGSWWPGLLVGMVMVLLLLGVSSAWAQGHPFAVGVPAPPPAPDGWLGRFAAWVSEWQSLFYRQLTGAVRSWQGGGQGGWLVGLSFAYGVFHALGPGHGKAVLASYVLANRETVRNGAVLAMLSALLQALVAVLLIGGLGWLLGWHGAAVTRAATQMEIVAYAMVAGLGAWMLWRQVGQWRAARRQPVGLFGTATLRSDTAGRDGRGDYRRLRYAGVRGEAGCDCGHGHLPAPALVAGRLDWHKAWVALLSMGLRPCSGALIVLAFAMAQDFFLAGVVAALAMGVGTGLTVSLLAAGALSVERLTLRLPLQTRHTQWLRRLIAVCAALMVLLLGLVLLAGALAAYR